ncbi:sensor histidine kinase [Clostridium sp.]|uniref:sensor histidine kinase n=1 Tax=Clostridium sp. TaxID=1506 RepID=UPI003463CB87
MKFWKKIFLCSIILFIILFNGAGIILIEKIHKKNIENSIASTINQYSNIVSTLYLNMDYNITQEITQEKNLKEWLELVIIRYLTSDNMELANIEVYDKDNNVIISRSDLSISGIREEIVKANNEEKMFLIRSVNGKKYLFISSMVHIQDQDIKLILSKDFNYIYIDRINNYKLFLLLDIITSLILAVSMFIISKKITEPIVSLSKISMDISKGDYTKRAKVVDRHDEIGVLAENFNAMIEVTEKNINELSILNDSKQRFIDSLTHEIKTPITSIIGYSDLLLRGKLDANLEIKSLTYINSEAKRIERLNTTLLKLILLREEKISLDELNIEECVINACEALSYKANSKDLDIDINVETHYVNGDKQLILVLLNNILDNAIKASTANGRIEIKGKKNVEKEIFELIIKDFGIGIPKVDLDKIKEPFYMVDKARIRKNNSVGLGLSICSEICEIHNIDMEIKSEVNEGTEVILKFYRENN